MRNLYLDLNIWGGCKCDTYIGQLTKALHLTIWHYSWYFAKKKGTGKITLSTSNRIANSKVEVNASHHHHHYHHYSLSYTSYASHFTHIYNYLWKFTCNIYVSTIVVFFSFSLVNDIVNVSMLPCNYFFCGCNLNSVRQHLFGYLVFCSVF